MSRFDPSVTGGRAVRYATIDGTRYLVLAKPCGRTFCQYPFAPTRPGDVAAASFVGRAIGYTGTGPDRRKLFAAMSECRHPRQYTPIDFVHVDQNPPWGVSTVVRARLSLTDPDQCWGEGNFCPETDLTYNEGSDSWTGSIETAAGTLGLELFYDADFPGDTEDWQLRLSGCIDTPYGSEIFPLSTLLCPQPWTRFGEWPFKLKSDCCDGATPFLQQIGFTVTSLGEWVYAARHVGYTTDAYGAKVKVFAFGECCEAADECDVAIDCCGCEASPFAWTFDLAGVTAYGCCAGLNTTYVLDWQGGAFFEGPCVWDSDVADVCTPGTVARLQCVPFDGVTPAYWKLSLHTLTGGAEYRLNADEWQCFGPNAMALSGTPSSECSGFPETLTLVAA